MCRYIYSLAIGGMQPGPPYPALDNYFKVEHVSAAPCYEAVLIACKNQIPIHHDGIEEQTRTGLV